MPQREDITVAVSTYHTKEDTLTVRIRGELDHHAAKTIRRQTDDAIAATSPQILVFDFSDVTFMDSSGIGLIMGRYRLMVQSGGSIVVRGAKRSILRVMKMAGLERLASFEGGSTDESK